MTQSALNKLCTLLDNKCIMPGSALIPTFELTDLVTD